MTEADTEYEQLQALIPPSMLRWFRKNINDWAEENLRDFPWRRTTAPYQIFIAEFLLQQTDAIRVLPVFTNIIEKYPSLENLSEASEDDLRALLNPLGFHFRATRILDSAKSLMHDPFNGNIPADEQLLILLPGVGPYMARSVCANAFNKPLAVLDTNVLRIIIRFFGITSKKARPRRDRFLWNAAQYIAPHKKTGLWNLSLIDFGAAICTSRKPRCSECPIKQRCQYYINEQF